MLWPTQQYRVKLWPSIVNLSGVYWAYLEATRICGIKMFAHESKITCVAFPWAPLLSPRLLSMVPKHRKFSFRKVSTTTKNTQYILGQRIARPLILNDRDGWSGRLRIESLNICLCLVQMRVRANATIAICAVVGHGHASTHSVHLRYARYAIYCSAEQMAEGTQYRNIGIERTATKSPGNWCASIGAGLLLFLCMCVCALFILNLSWFSIWYICLLACSLLSGWDAHHDCLCVCVCVCACRAQIETILKKKNLCRKILSMGIGRTRALGRMRTQTPDRVRAHAFCVHFLWLVFGARFVGSVADCARTIKQTTAIMVNS